MYKNFLKGFRETIGYMIFKKILLAYIVFITLLTAYQIYSELESSKNRILEEFKHIQRYYYDTILYNGLWYTKSEDLLKVVKDIRRVEPEIIGITIVNDEGVPLIIDGIVDKEFRNNTTNKDVQFNSTPLIKHSFVILDEINNTNKELARVTFYTDKMAIFNNSKEGIYIILINLIISIYIFWILTIYVTNKYLTMPLKKLIDGIKDFEKHEEEKVAINFQLKNMQELTILANSFNKMSSKISEDIINLKQLTMIQNQQKKALEQANKAKDDFLANMSHELKTPLNSINLISSIMMKNRDERLNEKDVKNLSIINSCGNDLLFLINDVLDLSRLEAGEMQLNYEVCDIKAVITKTKDMFYPQIKEKGLNFVFEYDDTLSEIYTDKHRLKQVIKNLLSNAVKFIEHGAIRFFVKDLDDKMQIVVSDDGIGISKDKLAHIFDRFKQADESTTRKYGGTGLGLAICKDLIKLFNGDIQITSEVNVGTTVTVTIPKNLNMIDGTVKTEPKESKLLKENYDDNDFLFTTIDNDNNQDKKEIPKILVLDNDPISYMNLIIALNKEYKVQQANNFKEFYNKLIHDKYTLSIIDNCCISKNDIKKVINYEAKFVVVTDEKNELEEEIKNASTSTFYKPFDVPKICTSIKEII